MVHHTVSFSCCPDAWHPLPYDEERRVEIEIRIGARSLLHDEISNTYKKKYEIVIGNSSFNWIFRMGQVSLKLFSRKRPGSYLGSNVE